jgi:hypothetical protein
VEDINKILPGLNRRYDMMVIVCALAEHVGAALRILVRRNICAAAHARLVISRIEGTAFMRKNGAGGDAPVSENTPPQ